MQLSLVEQLPELNKSIFLDVFAKMCIDSRTKRPTLITLDGQRVPAELKVRCYNRTILFFPEGTIYKLDVKLVNVKNRRPFFSAVRNHSITRALEFFDYNLQVQKGIYPKRRMKDKAIFIRKT